MKPKTDEVLAKPGSRRRESAQISEIGADLTSTATRFSKSLRHLKILGERSDNALRNDAAAGGSAPVRQPATARVQTRIASGKTMLRVHQSLQQGWREGVAQLLAAQFGRRPQVRKPKAELRGRPRPARGQLLPVAFGFRRLGFGFPADLRYHCKQLGCARIAAWRGGFLDACAIPPETHRVV